MESDPAKHQVNVQVDWILFRSSESSAVHIVDGSYAFAVCKKKEGITQKVYNLISLEKRLQ